MSVCSVCGEKVKNFGGRIVRGANGEWVCKKCLKKAGIGVMKFSCQHITSKQVAAKINGDLLDVQDTAHANAVRAGSAAPEKIFGRAVTCKTCGARISRRAKRCPHCGEMTQGEVLSQAIIGLIAAPFILIAILIAVAFYLELFSFFIK